MIRTIGFILVSIIFIESISISHENPLTHFTVSDSVNIEVNAYDDSLGLLESYSASVFTPVCEGDKCYAIEIIFYWDFIGRFHHYDTIPGKGLTKLDHEPFTLSDYLKLDNILTNSNSLLASYTKDELVKNTRSSEIDGITGATINEIKESVISGAVYSCFTLWHIANGPVVDSIQKSTKNLLSKDLVKKMVSQKDQEINYYLINNFTENDFASYLREILQTIQDGKGYFAKNVIEKMSEDIAADSLSQHFFASSFTQLDYFAQVALLEKLNAKSLSGAMTVTLKQNIDDRDSYKNELIKSLLKNENDP